MVLGSPKRKTEALPFSMRLTVEQAEVIAQCIWLHASGSSDRRSGSKICNAACPKGRNAEGVSIEREPAGVPPAIVPPFSGKPNRTSPLPHLIWIKDNSDFGNFLSVKGERL